MMLAMPAPGGNFHFQGNGNLSTEGEHIVGDLTVRARALGLATPILDVAREYLAVYETARRARETSRPKRRFVWITNRRDPDRNLPPDSPRMP